MNAVAPGRDLAGKNIARAAAPKRGRVARRRPGDRGTVAEGRWWMAHIIGGGLAGQSFRESRQ